MMNAIDQNEDGFMDGERCPLFPLEALLLPEATLPLQIFEPRYLMMVSRCSREDAGFVLTLEEPSLVRETLGCLGKIIDYGQLDNGLLGVTVAGLSRVAITAASKDETNLWWGDIRRLPEVDVGTRVEAECLGHYPPLLEALLEHPYLANQAGLHLESPRGSLHQLMVWLPLELTLKRHLLQEASLLERSRLLEEALSDLAGSK